MWGRWNDEQQSGAEARVALMRGAKPQPDDDERTERIAQTGSWGMGC